MRRPSDGTVRTDLGWAARGWVRALWLLCALDLARRRDLSERQARRWLEVLVVFPSAGPILYVLRRPHASLPSTAPRGAASSPPRVTASPAAWPPGPTMAATSPARPAAEPGGAAG